MLHTREGKHLYEMYLKEAAYMYRGVIVRTFYAREGTVENIIDISKHHLIDLYTKSIGHLHMQRNEAIGIIRRTLSISVYELYREHHERAQAQALNQHLEEETAQFVEYLENLAISV